MNAGSWVELRSSLMKGKIKQAKALQKLKEELLISYKHGIVSHAFGSKDLIRIALPGKRDAFILIASPGPSSFSTLFLIMMSYQRGYSIPSVWTICPSCVPFPPLAHPSVLTLRGWKSSLHTAQPLSMHSSYRQRAHYCMGCCGES